jgi:hypothetical protein
LADAYDLPHGYDDEAEFIKEARERFQEAADYDQKNRTDAEVDLKFFSGEQWEPDDLTARAGRPCLTINRMPQFVAQVVGDIRINQPAIKARPAEDADKALAEIREGLIRAIEYQSDAQGVYATAGQAQVACGIGNFRCKLDYLSDDAFERDIFIRPIPNPFAVVWDPMINDPTGRDARYCFVVDEMPRKVYEDKYGAGLSGELGQLLETQGWVKRDTVRVTEYWIIKERPAKIALLEGGKVEEITAANSKRLMPLVQKNSRGEAMVRNTTRKSVCMYLVSGEKILEKPVEYQISRVPIFRVPGWEVDTGGQRFRFGIVRFARDPQRLMNYWRSVMAEKLALAPRQQWLIHESQSGDQDDFRTAAKSGDTVLTWSGSVEPKRMEPPPIEAALLQESQLNAQDMKDVTGLQDASLGIRSNETSGKAILARQREGDVATYIYHDNLKAAIAECGKVINELIPAVYDTARTIRVVGQDQTQKVQRVNDPNDPESIDLAQGKYDIVVETGPSYSTKRVEAAESMLAFIQAVPTAGQVAGDLIAKAQDWPLADEIGDRLSKVLPPGLVQPDLEDMSAEEQQAYQQQKAQAEQQAQVQQEMQHQAAQLTLAEQDAKVMKLRAEAGEIASRAGASQGVPENPDMLQLDMALKAAMVRKANAEADEAEANAQLALAQVHPLAAKTEAEAVGARIAAAGDLLDLHAKPTEQALAHATTEKALKEPPKPAAKPKG